MGEDKFVTDDLEIYIPICYQCKHKHPSDLTCKAFPKGIPYGILTGEVDHHESTGNDNGVVFEQK